MYTFVQDTGKIIRDADGVVVAPATPENMQDHIAFVQWTNDGNSPTVRETVYVPEFVSMRKARLALLKKGIYAAVNEMIASIPGEDGDATRIEWEFASEVRRNSATVLTLVQALGWTDQELDELFIFANAILD